MSLHTKNDFTFGPFTFENGDTLPQVTLTYETWGELNEEKDNAILICHALTGTSHAASGELDESPGWWEFLIGPDKAVDTNQFFVICANVLGG
ncbi:MAG: alpha/beta fold hydrolase, partial [Calditrichaeota bacterium]|nr:alpha/beta fold hydrolase [Calditrichota bacterium]